MNLMTIRFSLLLAALASLLSSCTVPEGKTCHSYAYGPAYGGGDLVYPRPSHVADHGYPSYFERVHHHVDLPAGLGAAGYGTDCNSQIPYFLR
jgi:hypothetical protein